MELVALTLWSEMKEESHSFYKQSRPSDLRRCLTELFESMLGAALLGGQWFFQK